MASGKIQYGYCYGRTYDTAKENRNYQLQKILEPKNFVCSYWGEGSYGAVVCAGTTLSSGVKVGKGAMVVTGSVVPRKTNIPDWRYFDLDKMIHYREEYDLES